MESPGVALDFSKGWLEKSSRKKRWLVGVSGGADSMALLHILVDLGFQKLVVCHLDHRLRDKESTGDAKFVEKTAKNLGLIYESERVDVFKLAAETGQSLETTARNARLDFFGKCAQRNRCNRLILAHHADDQAETVLWNLLRGSQGLKGIREVKSLKTPSGKLLEIHRPLLGFRRSELRNFLTSRDLKWREDATNAEAIAVRNRLRNEVFPLLEDITGRDPVAMLARSVQASEDFESITGWALEQAKVIDPQNRLFIPALRKLPVSLQRAALAKFLGDANVSFDRELIERATGLLDLEKPASLNLPGGGKLRRREGRIFIQQA